MALSRTCPIYLKERRLRELMAEFNCTYRKALSMYVPPEPKYEGESLDKEQETEKEHLQEPDQVTNVNISPIRQTQKTFANTLKKLVSSNTKSQKNSNEKHKITQNNKQITRQIG